MTVRHHCFSVALTVAITSVSVTSSLRAQNDYPPELLDAAKREVAAGVKSDWRSLLIDLGDMSATERLDSVSLGEPYPEYRLELDKLMNLANCDSFKTRLTFVSWLIPVYVNSRPATLLIMDNGRGSWVFGGIGGNPQPFLEARALWPATDGTKISYIKDVSGPDFFMVERDRDVGLYAFRGGLDQLLGITRDASGRYPLLPVPYVVGRLKARGIHRFDPSVK